MLATFTVHSCIITTEGNSCCYHRHTQWRSWLRHCATNRKVAGSIPDGVIGIFHLTRSFGPRCGPWFDSASKRNKYQEYFLGGKGGRCVGLTTVPPSCADRLEIWVPQPPETPRPCPGLSWDCFTLYPFCFTAITRVSIVHP